MNLRFLIAAMACLAAQTSPAAAGEEEKWEGFRYAAKARPPFYQFLKDAVVVIETAGVFGKRAPSEEPDEWVDIKTEKPLQPPVRLRNKRGFQIETCRRAGLKRCPVMKRTTFGTGFILNGDTLVTCRHGFHNWLAWATRGNSLLPEGMAVPLRIRNDAGKVIYDSAQADPARLLRLAFFNSDQRINRPVDTGNSYPTPQIAFNTKASDYVEFKSPHPLAPVHAPRLLGGESAPSIGAEVYLFGYPEEVKGYRGGRVNGQNLAGSHGRILAHIPERGSLRTSNYSNVGMSGGPMLAPDGAIIGVSCGAFGMEQQMAAPENVNATGIVLDEVRLLELWSKLAY